VRKFLSLLLIAVGVAAVVVILRRTGGEDATGHHL
jgi:hypothetical protein